MIITPLFWIVLAPMIFPNLGWKGLDLYLRIHMVTLHSFPLIFSTVNIVMTDMKLDPNDWKKMVFMGCQYGLANGIGTYMTKNPIYPIVDWKSVPQTAFLFWL